MILPHDDVPTATFEPRPMSDSFKKLPFICRNLDRLGQTT
jgi:hypothetical protein